MKKLIAVSLYLLPTLAFAQLGGGNIGPGNVTGSGNALTNIENLVRSVGRVVNLLLVVVVAVALLLFFWGLARFIMAAGDEGAKERGRQLMIWGVIAFVVMLSIWGIVNFIQSALGIGGSFNILIPQV